MIVASFEILVPLVDRVQQHLLKQIYFAYFTYVQYRSPVDTGWSPITLIGHSV